MNRLVFLSFVAFLGSHNDIFANANCCKPAGDSMMDSSSCPDGYQPQGTVMGGSEMFSPCCKVDANGNTMGVDDSPDMPTCGEEGSSSTTGDSIPDIPDMPDMSGGSDTTTSGGSFECNDELYKKFPSCNTCIYACGSDEPACYEGMMAGDCSPTCFSGGMTTCPVSQKDDTSDSVSSMGGDPAEDLEGFNSGSATLVGSAVSSLLLLSLWVIY